jgi:hypothetical protein
MPIKPSLLLVRTYLLSLTKHIDKRPTGLAYSCSELPELVLESWLGTQQDQGRLGQDVTLDA